MWLSHARYLHQKWACQLGRLRPMRLRPPPRRNFRATCLSTGPSLGPLGYAAALSLLVLGDALKSRLEGCSSFGRRAARRTSDDHSARSLPPRALASLGGEGCRCMHPRLPSLRPSGPRPFPPALCPPVQEPLVDTPHRSTGRGRSFAAGRCIMIATPR